MVVDPVDAGLDEAEEIDEEQRQDGVQAGDVGDVFGGDLELQHHDGDDDGDDSVGEGFEAAWGQGLGHGLCKEAYIRQRSVGPTHDDDAVMSGAPACVGLEEKLQA